MIRTKSGEKGPYSIDQLQDLVNRRKIPTTLDVIESETGLAVEVGDLVESPAVAPSAPTVPAAPPEPEAPPPLPPSPEPVQTPTARSAPSRKPARRSTRRGKPGRSAGPARPAGRGARSSRAYDFQPRKSKAPLVLGIVVAVVVVGAGGFYILGQRAVDRALRTAADAVNEKCPLMLDEFTRLEKATVQPGRTLSYRYTIVGIETHELGPAFVDEMRSQLIARTRELPLIHELRRLQVTLLHRYQDRFDRKIADIALKPGDY